MQNTNPANNKQTTDVAQLLEKQNIFSLLGVNDGTEEEREQFLDNVQEAIWEDFLEHDCRHLITKSEMAELQKILIDEAKDELQKQSDSLDFLDDKIPDLEELMLEKALELKEEMIKERVVSLMDLFGEKKEIVAKLNQAEEHFNNQEWKVGVELLNSIEVPQK